MTAWGEKECKEDVVCSKKKVKERFCTAAEKGERVTCAAEP